MKSVLVVFGAISLSVPSAAQDWPAPSDEDLVNRGYVDGGFPIGFEPLPLKRGEKYVSKLAVEYRKRGEVVEQISLPIERSGLLQEFEDREHLFLVGHSHPTQVGVKIKVVQTAPMAYHLCLNSYRPTGKITQIGEQVEISPPSFALFDRCGDVDFSNVDTADVSNDDYFQDPDLIVSVTATKKVNK